jgi:hypothetical protein
MRSISFTLLLAILAAAVCGAIGWRVREGNLDAIFGVPAVKAGERLYTDFQIADVARISVSAHGIRGEYVKTDKGWHSATAPHDRMDPRYAANIILFSLNLKVVDSADTDDINRDEVGLREDSIQNPPRGGISPNTGSDGEPRSSAKTNRATEPTARFTSNPVNAIGRIMSISASVTSFPFSGMA